MNKLTIATTVLISSLSWGQTYNNSKNASPDGVESGKVRSNTGNPDGGIGKYKDSLAEESYLHGINLGGGMSVGQPVFSLDYEYHLSNHFGIGAYGNYSSKKGASRPGIGAAGIDFKAHVSLHSLDLYVRPGAGVAYADDGTDRKVFFAPIFATGVALRVTDNIAVGVEHLQTFNWTSDDLGFGKTEALLASAQIRF